MAVGMALAAAPVPAQSFLEQLFGGGARQPSPAPPQPAFRPANLRGQVYDNDYRRYRREPQRSTRDDDDDEDERPTRDHSGKVRTVCVRMCDGFYFPVSNATSKRNLVRDQRKCQASCGEEAMLFYERAPGGDPAQMVDVGGRPYSGLPNAFLYRQTKVLGCACKPAPWSLTERARHLQYAAEEEARKAELVARAEAAAAEKRKLAEAASNIEGRKSAPPQPPAGNARVAVAAADALGDARATAHPEPALVPVPSGEPQAAGTAPPDEATPMAPTVPSETAAPNSGQAAAGVGPPVEPALSRADQHRPAGSRNGAREQARKAAARTEARSSRPVQRPSKVAAASTGAWFGGKSKFVYPGDAPARYR